MDHPQPTTAPSAKISITTHPSQDSGIGTSIHSRSDYDVAISLASEASNRPDIPHPTAFPRSAEHPAQRIVTLARGRRMTNPNILAELAATIRIVENALGDENGSGSGNAFGNGSGFGDVPPLRLMHPYERRIRARYHLPALTEVSEGASLQSSPGSVSASESRPSSSALTEGEDYSFISFEDAAPEPLTLQHPEEKASSEKVHERLPSPVFPPENGSSRFRERFSLDGPGVFQASMESMATRKGEGEKKGVEEKRPGKVCGSVRVARMWSRIRKAVGKLL